MSEITTSELNPSLFEVKKNFTLYQYRFVIGFLFILNGNIALLMMTLFSPLQTTLASVYDQSITFINFGTSLVSNVCYIPANFLANYIIAIFGVRVGLLSGSFLTVSGLWIQCLSRHGFIWIFLGQILGGIGQPFFYCTASKLANTWFGVQERTLAITVMLVTLNIGTLLGSYLPQYFVNINADNITILDQVAHMLLIFALIGTLFFALVVIFMREKPLTPPSKAAAAPKHNFFDSLKTLVKDRNPMMVIISAAMVFSSVNAYCGCLQQIAQNFNINGDQVGDILSIASLGSIIGAIAITSVFNRYRRFNLFLIILCVSSLVIMVGNIFATESGNIYLFAATIILYTSTTAPVLPISVDYSADLSFPVAEFTSTGLLYAIFSVTATVESLIADQIVSDDPTASGSRWAIIMTVICQILGTLPLFWVKENLKRTKYEQEETLDPVSGSTVC